MVIRYLDFSQLIATVINLLMIGELSFYKR